MTDKERRERYHAADPELYRDVVDKRIYTQSELDSLLQAANEAALNKVLEDYKDGALEQYPLAFRIISPYLSADQSLLAKHDEELEAAAREKALSHAAVEFHRIRKLERAEAAAVMETLIKKWRWASKLRDKSAKTPIHLQQIGWAQCADELEAAIPTNYADALRERIRRERELTLGPIQVFEEQLECVCESNVGLCVKHRIQILLRAALRPNPSHAVGKEPINAKEE